MTELPGHTREPLPYDPQSQGSLGLVGLEDFFTIMVIQEEEPVSFLYALARRSVSNAEAWERWSDPVHIEERLNKVGIELARLGLNERRRRYLESAKEEILQRKLGTVSGVPSFEGGPLPRPFIVKCDPLTGEVTPLMNVNERRQPSVHFDADALFEFVRDLRGQKDLRMIEERQAALVGLVNWCIMRVSEQTSGDL
jgi:hypothetical protein